MLRGRPEMAATRVELTASIMILRFMAPFVGLLPPVLARVPIGFLRLLSQKRKHPSGGASGRRGQYSLRLEDDFARDPQHRSRPYCNSISVSEHVVMMILSLVRNYIPSYQWGFALTTRLTLRQANIVGW
jgi:hypothetical protein